MPEYTVEEFERRINKDLMMLDDIDAEATITEEKKQRYHKAMLKSIVLGPMLMNYNIRYYYPALKHFETIENDRECELRKMYLYKNRQSFVQKLSRLLDEKIES